jgi:hypothetical protein
VQLPTKSQTLWARHTTTLAADNGRKKDSPLTHERALYTAVHEMLRHIPFIREGKEEKMFIAANPQYKTLDMYRF